MPATKTLLLLTSSFSASVFLASTFQLAERGSDFLLQRGGQPSFNGDRGDAAIDANRFDESSNVEIEPGDSVMQKSWGDASPIIIESHKLVFFTVPKVGCTVWKKLFRRIEGHANWWTEDPHDPHVNGLRYLSDLKNMTKAAEILNDPTWTKAIFVRDPKERLVSAYIDKVQHAKNPRWMKRACRCHNPSLPPCPLPKHIPDLPFAEFVDLAQTRCPEEHWNPQNGRVEAKYWPTINFVGHIETAHEDAKILLQRIGAWETFGSNGWGGATGEIFASTEAAPHATSRNADESWNRLPKYFTPELEAMVEEFYSGDFELQLFNLEKRKIDFSRAVH